MTALVCTVVLTSGAMAAASAWTAANFRGLVLGKSRIADMKRTLGEPEGAPAKGSTQGVDVYKYPGKGDMQGTLEVSVRHSDGVITSIVENLPVALPRTPAYKRFGNDYRSAFYSRAECAAKGGSAPLYRDENGAIEMIEYPAKGVALALDKYGYDVAGFLYLSAPPGSAKAPACVANTKRKAGNVKTKAGAASSGKSSSAVK